MKSLNLFYFVLVVIIASSFIGKNNTNSIVDSDTRMQKQIFLTEPIPSTNFNTMSLNFINAYAHNGIETADSIVLPLNQLLIKMGLSLTAGETLNTTLTKIQNWDNVITKGMIIYSAKESNKIVYYWQLPNANLASMNSQYYKMENNVLIQISNAMAQTGISNYKTLSVKHNGQNLPITGINGHPYSCHYELHELRQFLDHNVHILGNKLTANINFVFSHGAYDIAEDTTQPEGTKIKMHTPIVRLAENLNLLTIDNTISANLKYKNKALDLGKLCPPSCSTFQ